MAWFGVELLIPGAALFALLTWLSLRYLREGFADVRQYALAPDGGKWVLSATLKRNWWNCRCASVATCECLSTVARGLGRGCRALISTMSRRWSAERSALSRLETMPAAASA